MAATIRLEIVTPERIAYTDDVRMIIGRATDGEIGILPGHAALICGLIEHPLRVIKEDEPERLISLCSGFMEVQPEKITILASCAELPEEIDVKRAQAAKERAENRLKSRSEDIDMDRAEAALRRALTRLTVAERVSQNHLK